MKHLLGDRSPSLQRIVERQLRNWELEGYQHATPHAASHALCDFIALSRLPGSRGEEIAAELGSRLGWKVYDRELLELMAGDEESRRHLYSILDERRQNWMESLLSLCAPETLQLRDDYLHALRRTVYDIAHREPAIFVGRGAHILLPANAGLRVRFVARLSDRIANVAREREISEADARRAIKHLDEQRLAFMKRYFGVMSDNPEDYDVTVNTSRLTVPQACDVILAAMRRRAPTAVV